MLAAAAPPPLALHLGYKLIERDSFVLNELQTHWKKPQANSRLLHIHKHTEKK
jgi:hypothetical protein